MQPLFEITLNFAKTYGPIFKDFQKNFFIRELICNSKWKPLWLHKLSPMRARTLKKFSDEFSKIFANQSNKKFENFPIFSDILIYISYIFTR